jgi:hypothetical protein
MELGIGADADVGFAWSGAAMAPAPIERRELRGHRQQIGKSAALSVRAPYVVLSLRHFRLASWRSLSLGGWWPRIRRGAVTAARCLLDLLGPAQRVLAADGDRRRRFLFGDIPVRGDAGARTIGANDDAAAVEVRGRRCQHP